MHKLIKSQITARVEETFHRKAGFGELLTYGKGQPCFSLGLKTTLQNRFGEQEQVLLFALPRWPESELPTPQEWTCLPLARLQAISALEDLQPEELDGLLFTENPDKAVPFAAACALLHTAHPGRLTCFSQSAGALAALSEAALVPFESDLPQLCRQLGALAHTPGSLLLENRGLLLGGDSLEQILPALRSFEQSLPPQPEPGRAASPAELDPQTRRRLLAELRLKLGEARGRPLGLHPVDTLELRLLAASQEGKALAKSGFPYPAVQACCGKPLVLEEGLDLSSLPMESPLGATLLLHPGLGLVAAADSPAEASRSAEVFQIGAQAYRLSRAKPGFKPPKPAGVQKAAAFAGVKPLARPPFAGEIALVTGSASGIGKACAESLLRRGAAVVGLDINPAIAATFDHPSYTGIVCDVSREEDICRALEQVVERFGGLDMLVLNAGLFPGGCSLSKMRIEEFNRVINVNFTANVVILREAYPLLSKSPRYGRVVMIGSKNFRAPGPGAGAYSTSKAALTQLARLAALEWAADRIRVNVIHPDSVFDTALYTPEVLQARAEHYGMTVEQYKKRNLLKTEITSRDVAEMVAEMCGPLFFHMTGGQIQFDGGNDRTI